MTVSIFNCPEMQEPVFDCSLSFKDSPFLWYGDRTGQDHWALIAPYFDPENNNIVKVAMVMIERCDDTEDYFPPGANYVSRASVDHSLQKGSAIISYGMHLNVLMLEMECWLSWLIYHVHPRGDHLMTFKLPDYVTIRLPEAISAKEVVMDELSRLKDKYKQSGE